MKKLLLFLFLFSCAISVTKAQSSVQRVILFGIDGLHWEAPEKLNMPVFNSLINQGTYIQKSYMIVPHHPKIGDYSEYNSCSFPNPVLHQGTIFISPENIMIQELFSPEQQTAFVVNTTAYKSVSRGFSTCIMDASLSDDQVVRQAMKILETQDPVFMRVHLQTPGGKGYEISQSTPNKSYYRNIYGEDSPYVKAVEHADKLLGQFVAFLKQSGLWDETVLIVTSDHGQFKMGWHPLFEEESWMTPLLFAGPGVARGRRLSYFEHTDLAPTIAALLGRTAPNRDGGAGISITAIKEDVDISNYQPIQYIKTINQQIKEYNFLKAKMIIAAEDDAYFSIILALLDNSFSPAGPFNDQDKILDWSRAGNTGALIEYNELFLKKLRQLL
ncbi:MAG: sulfatase-like hydrolase/transferase [Bacteroidota bacterium]